MILQYSNTPSLQEPMQNTIHPTYNADILVVDDTHDNLRLLSKMLIEHGYYVRPVYDGKKAISAIQDQLPDLILLDIMMPGMDGYEPRRSLIVLIDGAELNVYGDPDVQLWDQAEIVLLPAIHGG